jgi:hypothetical protein
MIRAWLPLLAAAVLVAGCDEGTPTTPGDRTPPAAPRGLYSVTGDHQVTLHWLANTESDVAGYHIYLAPCATGDACPYERVGSVTGVDATTFVKTGLTNAVTQYFAVAAFDQAGNESDLSYDDVFDTPRPAGFGASLANAAEVVSQSGFDFSSYGSPSAFRNWNDPRTDMYFTSDGTIALMVVPSLADGGIQDVGYASTLDAVDFAPSSGWSPTGSVELIPGHNYVIWTALDPAEVHYAKFRVTGLSAHFVTFDWAYQLDPANRELKMKPVVPGTAATNVATRKP